MVLSTILGGCVGSESANGTGNTNDVTQVGELSEDKGGVSGVVLTDELVPIAGAQGGIAELGIVAVTNEAGVFQLGGLPPGRAVVSVIALGYTSTSQSVEIVAGQFTQAQFVLTKLPTLGPFHSTSIFKNIVGGAMIKTTPDCMFVTSPTGGGSSSTKTCQGAVTQCEPGPCEVGYGHCDSDFGCITPDWQTIIAEVMWTPTSSLTGRGFLLEVLQPNVTRSSGHGGSVDQSDPRDWMHLDSGGPLRTWIDRDVLAGKKEAWPGSGLRTIAESDWCGGIDGAYDEGTCDYHWRLFPAWCTVHGVTGGAAGCSKTGPDFAASQDQPSELHFTFFIGDPAPEGWTSLPDV